MILQLSSRDPREIATFLGRHRGDFRIASLHGPDTYRARYVGYELGELSRFREMTFDEFKVDCSDGDDRYCISFYHSGTVSFHGQRRAFTQSAGASRITSPGQGYSCTCSALDNTMTTLDASTVQRVCSSLLGSELDGPVVFDSAPMAAATRASADAMLQSLDIAVGHGVYNASLVEGVRDSLVTLLLLQHPHNYTRLLASRPSVSARDIAAARDFIGQFSATEISIAEVARHVGCHPIDLQRAFEEALGMPLSQYIEAVQAKRGETCRGDAMWIRGHGSKSVPRWKAGVLDGSEVLASGLAPVESDGGLSSQEYALVLRYVEEHIGEKHLGADLAQLLGMSRKIFATRFRTTFRMPLMQYVVLEKIKTANTVLQKTDLPLSTVALEAGFASQSHMTAAFRKYLGVTPGSVRVRRSRG